LRAPRKDSQPNIGDRGPPIAHERSRKMEKRMEDTGEFTLEFIEVNGVRLRYELSGKGDRTLVLVHEMGGSLESWDGRRTMVRGISPRITL